MLSESAIQALLAQLKEPFSCYRHTDDTHRMRRAAEVIESLLFQIHHLEFQNKAFRLAIQESEKRNVTSLDIDHSSAHGKRRGKNG